MIKIIWQFATIVVWIASFGVLGSIYYVNHYLPHGPMYPTGDIVCQNDDRGPCKEAYKEDMRGLDIPSWAKFFKRADGKILWIVLLTAGLVIHVYNPKYKQDCE